MTVSYTHLAKGFGWGGELNLEYCFEKLFGFGHGQGYPCLLYTSRCE